MLKEIYGARMVRGDMSLEFRLAKVGKYLDSLQLRRRLAFYVKQWVRNAHLGQSSWTVLMVDLLISVISFLISIHLRLGFDLSDFPSTVVVSNLSAFGLTFASVWIWMKIHKMPWAARQGEREYLRVCFASFASHVVYCPLFMLMNREEFLPYSILFIDFCVLSVFLLILRFTAAYVANRRVVNTIFVGEGRSIVEFCRKHAETCESFGCILSDDRLEDIRHLPILGYVSDIERIFKALYSEDRLPKKVVCTGVLPEIIEISRRYAIPCFEAL